MGRDVEVVFGPPGTGKTETLLRRIEEAVADGANPARVAYVAFTRVAAGEARSRIARLMPGIDAEEELPWWRTLHSAAYRRLGLRRGDVVTPRALAEFGRSVGMTFSARRGDEDGTPGETLGDRCLRLVGLAAARTRDVGTEYDSSGEEDLLRAAATSFAAEYTAWKRREKLLDFPDMIDRDRGQPLDVDLVVVDEAQDLTPQQWAYVRRLCPPDCRVLLAGDDDQAIYDWAGADVGALGRIAGRRTVLPRSWRIPRRIKVLADDVVGRIVDRVPKTWDARKEDGEVARLPDASSADLSSGQWLLLARLRRQLGALEDECRRQGVVYRRGGRWSNQGDEIRAVVAYERLRRGDVVPRDEAALAAAHVLDMTPPPIGLGAASWGDLAWPFAGRPDWMAALTRLPPREREYVRDLRRRGESLTRPGRVRVSTVHGAKGAESEHVLLITDVGSRVARTAALDPDPEARVAYVAVTRASRSLNLVAPESPHVWASLAY